MDYRDLIPNIPLTVRGWTVDPTIWSSARTDDICLAASTLYFARSGGAYLPADLWNDPVLRAACEAAGTNLTGLKNRDFTIDARITHVAAPTVSDTGALEDLVHSTSTELSLNTAFRELAERTKLKATKAHATSRRLIQARKVLMGSTVAFGAAALAVREITQAQFPTPAMLFAGVALELSGFDIALKWNYVKRLTATEELDTTSAKIMSKPWSSTALESGFGRVYLNTNSVQNGLLCIRHLEITPETRGFASDFVQDAEDQAMQQNKVNPFMQITASSNHKGLRHTAIQISISSPFYDRSPPPKFPKRRDKRNEKKRVWSPAGPLPEGAFG